jgi:NADPH:quinone reductase
VAYIGERGYAEFETVSAAALFPSPDDLGDNLFLAEPLACAMNVFRRSAIRSGDHVAVLGSGFLGTLLVQLAVAAGANVWALGRRRSTLAFAEEHGAKIVEVQDRASAIAAIASATGGKLCDVVIEATGHQEPLDLGAELTRVRGRLVIAGYHQDSPRPINLQLWNWRGLDVINAHERETSVYLEGMQLAREAIAEGRLTTKGLITHVFPLEDLGTALNMAAERPRGFLKGVIRL